MFFFYWHQLLLKYVTLLTGHLVYSRKKYRVHCPAIFLDFLTREPETLLWCVLPKHIALPFSPISSFLRFKRFDTLESTCQLLVDIHIWLCSRPSRFFFCHHCRDSKYLQYPFILKVFTFLQKIIYRKNHKKFVLLKVVKPIIIYNKNIIAFQIRRSLDKSCFLVIKWTRFYRTIQPTSWPCF